MEEFIKKLLFEDWSLSRLYETINSIKETETNKTIMFRIGKILGGKVDNCKWKTTSDEHIFVFSIIYNNETEKHKIKIYHGSPKIKFDNYVSGGRMKVGKEFPLPRKDISKKDIIEKYDNILHNSKQIKNIISSTYDDYDQMAIYRYRQIALLILLSHRHKSGIFSTLPKDIAILIAKKVFFFASHASRARCPLRCRTLRALRALATRFALRRPKAD